MSDLRIKVPRGDVQLLELVNQFEDKSGNPLDFCLEAGVPYTKDVLPGDVFLCAKDQPGVDSLMEEWSAL